LADDASKQSISNDCSYGEETKAGTAGVVSVMTQRQRAAGQAAHPCPSAAWAVSKRRKQKRFSFKAVPKEVAFCACSDPPFHLKIYKRDNVSRQSVFVFCCGCSSQVGKH